MLRMLMAAESRYYESLASFCYIEEVEKGYRTRCLQQVKTPYLYFKIDDGDIWAEAQLFNRK